MSNILLECSQSKAETVYNNGDYETYFAQPVSLESGDRFALSKCFIDNEIEDDGIITIPSGGIDVTYSVQPYIVNDTGTKFDTTLSENTAQVDNGEYLLYLINKDDGSGTQEEKVMELITQINFAHVDGEASWGDKTGDTPVRLLAQDFNGVEFPVFVNIPPQTSSFADITVSIYCKRLTVGDGDNKRDISLQKDNSDGSWTFNKCAGLSFSGTQSVFTGKQELSRVTFEPDTPIHIDEGKYTPQDIVLLINNGMSVNGTPDKLITGVRNLLRTPFLHLSNDFTFSKTIDTATPPTPHYVLVPSDPVFSTLPDGVGGIKGIAPTATTNFFIGTNLIELAYSDSTNKFYWNYNHFPIYDSLSGSEQIVTKFVKTSGTTTTNSTYIQNGKNAGVIFKDLSATSTSTGEFFDFWTAILGFVVGGKTGIVPQTTHHEFTANSPITYVADIPNIIEGQHSTAPEFLIDGIVNKETYQRFPVTTSGDLTAYEATSSLNNVIYANNSIVSSGVLSTAYYLVEIQLSFTSNIIGEDTIVRNISGIINRYYSKGSYISGGGDPSFVIDYKGEPVVISSMRVRITNPDGSLAGVGVDNTMFFELIKANVDLSA